MDLPGMLVDAKGIHPKSEKAVDLDFAGGSSAGWKSVDITSLGETVKLNGAHGAPDIIQGNLLRPGVRIHFSGEALFTLHCAATPYLTWLAGSVSQDVPTPASPWLALSFDDDVPPFLFCFDPKRPMSLVIQGDGPEYTVRTTAPYDGWMQVVLPSGTDGVVTNTAATLGHLALSIDKQKDFWMAPAPILLSRTATQIDADGMTVAWRFSGPYAVVPAAFQLATIGGYPCEVLSPTISLPGHVETGRMQATVGDELLVRLPVREVPRGRFLAGPLGLSRAGFLDDPTATFVDEALATLASSRSASTLKTAQDHLRQLVEAISKPNPTAPVPEGNPDLIAAEALLQQSLYTSSGSSETTHPFLKALVAQRDWWLDELRGVDPVAARRAEALAAVAGAISSQPEARFQGAMFQVGMASERGLRVLKERESNPSSTFSLIEPLDGIRVVLFRLKLKRGQKIDSNLGLALVGELHVLGPTPVVFTVPNRLSWVGSDPIFICGPTGIAFSSNSLSITRAGGINRVIAHSAHDGTCRLELPMGSPPPPETTYIPPYSEPKW